MADENEVTVNAPVQSAGWLYFLPKNKELIELIASVSLIDKHEDVVISPLLSNLLVENDLQMTSKTPTLFYNDSIVTKMCALFPYSFLFYGTEDIIKLAEDHGDLKDLCRNVRKKTGLQEFEPLSKKETNIKDLCTDLNLNSEEVMCHVTFGIGFKELVYYGLMIPCIEEKKEVQIGEWTAIKVPLYSYSLFENGDFEKFEPDNYSDFVNENGFYNGNLSKTLFYFIFTSWATSLRFTDTKHLIKAGLHQFINDEEQTVKLTMYKTYHGISNQKINPMEKDYLLLTDAIITELTFSYSSEYFNSFYDTNNLMNFNEWPIIKEACDHETKLKNLNEFKLHLTSHVGAALFANNSILYCNRIAYASQNKQNDNSVTHENLLKSIYLCNSLGSINDDYYTSTKTLVKNDNVLKEDKYGLTHLAYACATSEQLLSHVVWCLNRMSIYSSGGGPCETFNHIVNSSSGLCDYCHGRCCQSCIGTAMVRVGNRFPVIPKQPKKEPIVITMFARNYAEVDALGSFGRKSNMEQREMKDGQSAPSLDRIQYINNILEYCKRNSLMDVVSGSDTLNFRNRKEFINMIKGLIQCVDESVLNMISEMRRTQTFKDQIDNTVQSFNLETNPYSLVFSPFLTFCYFKVMLVVLQHLALTVATGYVVDRPCTGNNITRWVSQQFQTIYGSFTASHFKKGFFNMKTFKIKNPSQTENIMNFQLYRSGNYTKLSMPVKMYKLTFHCLRDFRVKNRPINRGPKSPHSPNFFKRPSKQKKNPIGGCLSFLLFKYHEKLFPGCSMSCLELWQKIFQNALPKSVDIGCVEEFDFFLRNIISITEEYDNCDLMDVQPESMSMFIECLFHNKFLNAVGHKEYIVSLHGLVTKIVPSNYSYFPILINSRPKFTSVNEYLLFCKKLKIEGVPPPLISTLVKESNFQSIFPQKSIVTFGLSIEKFVSLASKEFFHFGQFGYISGTGVDRHLNSSSFGMQDYKFLRQKYLIATKLMCVLAKKVKREMIMFDAETVRSKIMSIIESPSYGVNPEFLIIAEIMKDKYEKPSLDDLCFFVDGKEELVNSISNRIDELLEKNVTDFSLNNILDAVGENGNNAVTYDFSSIFTDDEQIVTDQTNELDDEPLTKKSRL
ncbi:single stranded DNA binding protein [Murid herpesvirus 3]|uniref:Single stranded DNA binding protein n=2 Tax=Murid betaherpesvirus 3 TaxID=2560603 RepID=A0A1P8VIT5_9BETA|nr:single stranded DNA binding protein [Murine roseolovirus]APZ76270.1 single stranded DNA binding protein [Murid betaherpesvirus 3]AYH64710.1 single stranded DNA binding protein [Murid herpesvirus 3]